MSVHTRTVTYTGENGSGDSYTWQVPAGVETGGANWITRTKTGSASGTDTWSFDVADNIAGNAVTRTAVYKVVHHTYVDDTNANLFSNFTITQYADGNVVADTTAPVLTLNGAASVTVAHAAPYTDLGATATDDIDDDAAVTSQILRTGMPVDTNTAGTYTIAYNVSDTAGNAATEITRTLIISPAAPAPTTIAPTYNVVTDLNNCGNNGGTWAMSATDASGSCPATPNTLTGNTNETVTWTLYIIPASGYVMDSINDVSASLAAGGTGTITQSMTANGNIKVVLDTTIASANIAQSIDVTGDATQLTPEGDSTVPVITLLGATTVNLALGDTVIDPGYTASDDTDGDITANVVSTISTVNANVANTYTVTYNVDDAAGNSAIQMTRQFIVTAYTGGIYDIGGNSLTSATYFENTPNNEVLIISDFQWQLVGSHAQIQPDITSGNANSPGGQLVNIMVGPTGATTGNTIKLQGAGADVNAGTQHTLVIATTTSGGSTPSGFTPGGAG